jgi:hypothetical protein
MGRILYDHQRISEAIQDVGQFVEAAKVSGRKFDEVGQRQNSPIAI